ncbi:erythromycin esterase family protein [Deinococcus sp. Leaf326]|uniref:erythromycin esterase family protein n=1 Tax=Deinococcus sp. Leaf326 TaxID=1736338 RepID=UPI0006FF3565|nr:erythromycin esterase family protein [Deinococcus sp. Leaf326]KQR41049.1 erythromycin esterase [Deinococcus sp. Leaf326]
MSTLHLSEPGWDMTRPGAALASLFTTLPVRPRLLALGEPTHGDEGFLLWRNRFLRALVEEHGFRSIAIESDAVAGLRVNAHVTAGEATLDEVIGSGFSHGFGAYTANHALVAWLREVNAGRDRADQVCFYGFDPPLENMWAASPRTSLLALHAFLTEHGQAVAVDAATLKRLCGDDAHWTDEAAALNPAASLGRTPQARELRVLADDLATLLCRQAPELAARPGFWEAGLHARTATGLLRYHAVMADLAPTPTRVERMLALRDLLMADHLTAVADRERPRGPTLVFAHNSHLQRPRSEMRMRGETLGWWSAGAHLDLRLGGDYAFVASHRQVGAGQGIPTARLFAASDLGGLALPTPDGTPQGFPLKAEQLPFLDGLLLLGAPV